MVEEGETRPVPDYWLRESSSSGCCSVSFTKPRTATLNGTLQVHFSGPTHSSKTFKETIILKRRIKREARNKWEIKILVKRLGRSHRKAWDTKITASNDGQKHVLARSLGSEGGGDTDPRRRSPPCPVEMWTGKGATHAPSSPTTGHWAGQNSCQTTRFQSTPQHLPQIPPETCAGRLCIKHVFEVKQALQFHTFAEMFHSWSISTESKLN